MKTHSKNFFTFLFAFVFSFTALSQSSPLIPLKHGAHSYTNRDDAYMQRWREYGLGQFIHWGVYSIPGGQWNGQTTRYAAEWFRTSGLMTVAEYDNLYKQFDPVNFDAHKWAEMAQQMGVKYMIFTTKHHDGFCMWPSKYTTYNIGNTPYKKDIVKELVDAYTAVGIDVYLYFSIIDWSHPGYVSGGNINSAAIKKKYQTDKSFTPFSSVEQESKYEDFKQFTRNQLLELLDNYKSIKGLWFDGSWDVAWVKNASWVDSLGVELRQKHPGLIIGSRFRSDELGNRHQDANGHLIDDYDQRYERNLPRDLAETKGFDWDCVMTIPENQWGYHRDWSFSYVKTPYDLTEMLAKAVSLNGNFVVNFGPDGLGNIRAEETKVAKEMGKWMKKNSEAIYGAYNSILEKQDWGYSTQKGDSVYLIISHSPVNNLLRVKMPRTKDKNTVYFITSAQLLSNGKSISVKGNGKTGTYYRDKYGSSYYDIELPTSVRKTKMPFVVKIVLKQLDKGELEYQQALT
ncbi:MAG: alpha-L-fucosidase [Paludibacteraceae bacterium]